jgi:hypothetical protein
MGASHPKGMLGAGHKLRLARIGTYVFDKVRAACPKGRIQAACLRSIAGQVFAMAKAILSEQKAACRSR